MQTVKIKAPRRILIFFLKLHQQTDLRGGPHCCRLYSGSPHRLARRKPALPMCSPSPPLLAGLLFSPEYDGSTWRWIIERERERERQRESGVSLDPAVLWRLRSNHTRTRSRFELFFKDRAFISHLCFIYFLMLLAKVIYNEHTAEWWNKCYHLQKLNVNAVVKTIFCSVIQYLL